MILIYFILIYPLLFLIDFKFLRYWKRSLTLIVWVKFCALEAKVSDPFWVFWRYKVVKEFRPFWSNNLVFSRKRAGRFFYIVTDRQTHTQTRQSHKPLSMIPGGAQLFRIQLGLWAEQRRQARSTSHTLNLAQMPWRSDAPNGLYTCVFFPLEGVRYLMF